jgi:hypothetical protein
LTSGGRFTCEKGGNCIAILEWNEAVLVRHALLIMKSYTTNDNYRATEDGRDTI